MQVVTDPESVTVRSADEPGPALEVRRAVFVEEQGVSPDVEFDEKDGEACHFVAEHDGEAVATARVRFLDGQTARVERVAVRPAHRGVGLGRQIVEAAHAYARDAGRTRALVHAQERVRSFYESLGYEYVRDVDSDTDIPHVVMETSL